MTTEVHPLQNTWVLWKHSPVERNASLEQWNKSMNEVCEFNTVEDFWKVWSFIPRPSEIFSEPKQSVDTYSVFKKGIKPQWEDKENAKGGEIFLRKTFSNELCDLYWENLVLGLIGEGIEEDDEICGCRIVDKTKRGGRDNRPMYRFEVWLRVKDQAIVEKMKQRVADVLTDGKPKAVVDQFSYTDH